MAKPPDKRKAEESCFINTHTKTETTAIWPGTRGKGENATKTRTAMIRTGTKRSTNGGGGSGGKTRGSTTRNTVKIVKIMTDMMLKYLNINLWPQQYYRCCCLVQLSAIVLVVHVSNIKTYALHQSHIKHYQCVAVQTLIELEHPTQINSKWSPRSYILIQNKRIQEEWAWRKMIGREII